MLNELKTKWKGIKYHGYSSSHIFNEFVDNAYEDFSALKRSTVLLAEETSNMIGKMARAQMSLSHKMQQLTDSERDNGTTCAADLSVSSNIEYIDSDNEVIPVASRLYHSPMYGYLSLQGNLYENFAVNTSLGSVVPDYIETNYESVSEAADSRGDDTRKALSVWNQGIWERFSLLDSDATPTQGRYYVKAATC
jgi:hypothetical protein